MKERKKEGNMPEISVVIPVYNVEAFLPRCLDSVLNQTFQDFEIVCVNDASPDNSAKILNQYQQEFPQVKVFTHQTNKGLGEARNTGVKHAKGKYVCFLDSDDYLKEDFLFTYDQAMDEKTDLVIGGYIKVLDKKEKVHIPKDSYWAFTTYTIACAKLYKIDFLKEHHLLFSSAKFGEDILFSLELFLNKPTYKVLDYAGYCYVLNPQSLSQQMDYSKEEEKHVVSLFDSVAVYMKGKPISEQQEAVVQYVYFANMILSLLHYGRGAKPKLMKEKYRLFSEDLEKRFPSWRKNPLLSLSKVNGQTLKIKLSVWVLMNLHRHKGDWPIFFLFSFL